ncbi:FG-GAP-like repeat-containing protein [Streptomyces sp. NPDC052015]|uniref:FG-GAP-like repeat-containing protein n=1 Tax=Streptomyces sp. NPDC052015 TaxID=3154755 RepID=UPI0034162583
MSPRRTHAYKPLSIKRRAWLTLGAVALSGAGIVTYAIADPGTQSGGGNGAARKAVTHTLKLKDHGGGRKGLGQRETERFSAVVVTWDDEHARTKGTPEVRTRDLKTGAWSAWQKLPHEPNQADGAEGERAALRGATESLWTGDSDGIEVRVVNADGTEAAGQPAGMDVRLIDPGTDPKGTGTPVTGLQPAAFAAEGSASPTDTSSPTDSASPSDGGPPTDSASPTDTASPTDSSSPTVSPSPSDTASPSAPTSPSPTIPAPRPSTVKKPPIITQAQWGAGTNYDGTPSYGTEIKAAVLHHTGVSSDNTISCAQTAARLRSIQQAHIAQGYFDMGYNFVVDKCGQIFEGRSGGVDLPVTGAHDIGFNPNTLGISYLGNYETATPSRAGLDAIARLIAWKFGMYGIDPTGKVTLTSGSAKGVDGNLVEKGTSITVPRVLGHRDTNATACPGRNLYPKLGLIAAFAKTPGISHALPTSDYNRDGISDLVAGTPRANSVTVVPGSLTGAAPSRKVTLTQNSAGVPGSTESGDNFGASAAWGDVNGDGRADLAVGAPGEDDTSGNADRGTVTVLYGPGLNSGFTYTTTGVTAAGAKLGAAVAVGDFNGDGRADVFSAGNGRGGNYNVLLTGVGSRYGTLTTATAAVSYLDAAAGDFNRDGYADVAVNYRDSAGIGRVVRFAGSATGLTKAGVLSVRGGRSIAAGDINANGYDDIVIGQPVAAESGGKSGGQVTMLQGTSTGFTTTGMSVVHQDSAYVADANETGDLFGASVSVGDFNADGFPDALVGTPGEDIGRDGANRVDAGSAYLLKGTSAGLTGSGSIRVSQDTSGISGATETSDKFGSAVSLTDLSGFGRADLTFGVEGEDVGNGLLMYLPSGGTGLGYTQTLSMTRTALGTPASARLGRLLTP